MTPQQIELVQTSWDMVRENSEKVAGIFYEQLFNLVPEAQKMFTSGTKEQGGKLMAAIGMVVDALNDLEPVIPTIEELAIRHVNYGVEPMHYDHVGEALLSTLKLGLGDAFTSELQEAWTATYEILSSTMKNAAYSELAT